MRRFTRRRAANFALAGVLAVSGMLAPDALAAKKTTTTSSATTTSARKGGSTKTSTTTTTTSTSTNQAPVAHISPSQTVSVGQLTHVYSMTSYDPDGNTISWSWRQTSGPSVTLNNVEPGHISFTPPVADSYVIQVTVTDSHGASSSKSTTVTATSTATTTTTTTAPSTTTTTTPTSSHTVKGESSTGTVEPRLLSDPNVLWVGTWDSSNWQQLHGVGTFGNSFNTAVGSFGNGSAGNALRGKASAGSTNGFGYAASFVPAGFNELEEAYYRYRVYFPSDYVWTNSNGGGGGKLPGLAGKAAGGPDSKVGAGGQRWNGSTEIDGAHLDDMDGWSARLLWQKDGGLSSYLYVPDPNHLGPPSSKSYFGWAARCKVDPYNSGSANKLFNKGAWNTVEAHVRMNTPGVSDGIYELWMNGSLCLRLTNMRYRSAKHPEVRISQQYVSWFYGGPSSDAPDRDSYVYIDDAVISKGYIGPRLSS